MQVGDVIKMKIKDKTHNALVIAVKPDDVVNVVYVSEAAGEHGNMPVTVLDVTPIEKTVLNVTPIKKEA